MNVESSDSEAVITEIVERLEERFPRTSHDAICAAVDAAQAQFSRARVKDFVPLFIEREARARLERLLPSG